MKYSYSSVLFSSVHNAPFLSAFQILWIEPGTNVFLMQTVLYHRGTKALDDQYDPEKMDVAVNLQFGKAHVIMLYWFLRRVVVSTLFFPFIILWFESITITLHLVSRIL